MFFRGLSAHVNYLNHPIYCKMSDFQKKLRIGFKHRESHIEFKGSISLLLE